MTMSDNGDGLADTASVYISSSEAQSELAAYVDVAEKFVEDIIAKATHEVAHNKQRRPQQLERQTTLHNPPEIQIDLVGPRSPTPEEETFPWIAEAATAVSASSGRQNVHQDGDNDDDDCELNSSLVKEQSTHKNATKYEQSTVSVGEELMSDYQKFALDYVTDILGKATEVAAEQIDARPEAATKEHLERFKVVPTATVANATQSVVVQHQPKSHHVEVASRNGHREATEDSSSGPWHLRLRLAFGRLMRSACLCKGSRPEPNEEAFV